MKTAGVTMPVLDLSEVAVMALRAQPAEAAAVGAQT
jgi:hypothetical protein